MNADQINPIHEALKQNTQSSQAIYNLILLQNTMFAQFKEDASRKLEEGIKATLKEKINEINRENSREITNIRNVSSSLY
jgi:hypothetical protein